MILRHDVMRDVTMIDRRCTCTVAQCVALTVEQERDDAYELGVVFCFRLFSCLAGLKVIVGNYRSRPG